jgi:hypothetical protein
MAKIGNAITILGFVSKVRGYYAMDGAFEQTFRHEAQKVTDVDKNWWKRIIFRTWGIYRNRSPFGIRSLDFKARLVRKTKEES